MIVLKVYHHIIKYNLYPYLVITKTIYYLPNIGLDIKALSILLPEFSQI